ncbi:hypothetical protein ACFQ7B_07605 [Streptomyces erythrochromogenes]|uniref:hypothetical protein n=1 Tax=Streptomyces erythrochromogenes TaxID=285574 RepID=UPI00367C86D2
MRTIHAATLGLALFAATGCGTDASTASKAPSPSATAAAAPTSSPSPSPTPTPDPVFTVGHAWAFEGTIGAEQVTGNAAVLGYRHKVRSVGSAADESGTAGYVWAALDVKVCSDNGTFVATDQPWTLTYADGARIAPSSTTFDDFPKPAFPFETTLTAGKCVKGNIVFAVPDNPRPSTAAYAPNGLATPREWDLSKL